MLAVAILALGLDVWGRCLDHPIGGSWVERGREAFTASRVNCRQQLLGAAGQSLVQHARFRFHLGLSFCVMVVWVIWEFIEPWMMYNFNLSKPTADWLDRGLQAIVLGGAFYLALSFSTRLSSRMRALLAGLIPLLILGSGVTALFEKKPLSPRARLQPCAGRTGAAVAQARSLGRPYRRS